VQPNGVARADARSTLRQPRILQELLQQGIMVFDRVLELDKSNVGYDHRIHLERAVEEIMMWWHCKDY